jgi:radical SAM superfamily enzyme YgiQ (UPF0313 family)
MPASLDLLLLNPNTKKVVYQGLSTRLTAIEPPVWAGLMASFVRRKGRSVAILDAEAEGLSPVEIGARVAAIGPRLLAIPAYGHQPSASTQVMPGVRQAAAAVREAAPDLPILLLGGHVAALPERTLAEEPCDFVAGGEGLYTLADLLECLETTTGELSKVRGLYWRDGGRVVANRPAPLAQSLDEEMPGVAWDLLPMERYRAHNWHCFGESSRQPYAALYTTLGCPYHCSFCCIQAPFKDGEAEVGVRQEVNSYRYWSIGSVLAQIDELVRVHGVRHLKIADEMFVLSKRHVTALCRGIVERGYDLNIWAYSRVDTVAEGLLEELGPAGVRWLALGIEAANERVRDHAQKGIGRTDVETVVRRIREAGLYVIGNYIFGLPEDDLGTMQQTLDLAEDLNCEFANFYAAMAYPGSQLFREAQAKGWRLPDGWSGYSQHAVDTLPLPTRHVTSAQVLRFRDEAFRRYFENPRYLEMVRRTFGESTVADVKDMLSVQLVRRHA